MPEDGLSQVVFRDLSPVIERVSEIKDAPLHKRRFRDAEGLGCRIQSL